MTASEDTKEGYRKRAEAGAIPREVYEHILDMPGPEFVPPSVVYLASDYGAKINGCVFSCAGGKIALESVPDETHAIYKDFSPNSNYRWSYSFYERS